MNVWRRLMLGALLLLLGGILALLYMRAQTFGQLNQEHVLLALREMRELDAQWDVNILKSHTGLNHDYDPVTTPLRHMRETIKVLEEACRFSKTSAPRQELANLKAALEKKEKLVERFKSQHAILRNSLIYFPSAIDEFKIEIDNQAATLPALKAQLLYALDTRINGVQADILRFNLHPEAALGERISTQLLQLEQQRAMYPESVGEHLAQLSAHVQAILRQRVIEAGLLNGITGAPTSAILNNLSDAFVIEFDLMAQQRQKDRLYLFLYSGFLLMVLMLLASRLIKSYQMVAQMNRRLVSANELLEQRVAERTAELEAQSARLAELATHDALTGLVNCAHLMTLLARALLRSERRGSIVVVMFIDLDGFKAVNDTWGHHAGDLVLKEVAQKVPSKLRAEDTLARLGGDEFVILLEDASTREGAIRVAQEALRQIESVTEVAGHAVKISASIGISSVQGRIGASYSADALLDEADHAMYQAKQAGKGCIRFNQNAQFRTPLEPLPPPAATEEDEAPVSIQEGEDEAEHSA
ncbi:DAHL domain-containing protein [Massilia sp. W12]|uniref:DAHL domain-containing protein n=1 Tax=Massilia sp. W12 TaxID=3126507 RepID=UPI0030CABB31